MSTIPVKGLSLNFTKKPATTTTKKPKKPLVRSLHFLLLLWKMKCRRASIQ